MTAAAEDVVTIRPVLSPVPSGARTLDADGRIGQACAALTAGRPVLVTGIDAGPGHLVAAAGLITPEVMAFVVRHTSGFVCVALPEDRADALDLPPQPRRHSDAGTPAFGVSVDAAEGVTTGISATDRSHTARLLAAPDTTGVAFSRPGHMITLRATDGGLLRAAGRAEAAIDLLSIAGLAPVAVVCDLVLDQYTSGSAAELRRHRNPGAEFLLEHGLVSVSVSELARFRRRTEPLVHRAAAARIPTGAGEFTAVGYRSTLDAGEHVAFVSGGPAALSDDVAVHVHRESVIGDVFGGTESALTAKLAEVGTAGGVVVYLRSAEGSANGVVGTLQHLFATDNGAQTLPIEEYPANLVDIAVQILRDLGVRSLRLLTADDALRTALTDLYPQSQEDTAGCYTLGAV